MVSYVSNIRLRNFINTFVETFETRQSVHNMIYIYMIYIIHNLHILPHLRPQGFYLDVFFGGVVHVIS